MSDPYRVDVEVRAVDDGDVEELTELTSELRSALLDLDTVNDVGYEEEQAPDDAKGLTAIAGWLAVRLASAAGLKAVIATIRDWVGHSSREVEITIGGDTLRVTRATAEEQSKMIETFLARHADSPST